MRRGPATQTHTAHLNAAAVAASIRRAAFGEVARGAARNLPAGPLGDGAVALRQLAERVITQERPRSAHAKTPVLG